MLSKTRLEKNAFRAGKPRLVEATTSPPIGRRTCLQVLSAAAAGAALTVASGRLFPAYAQSEGSLRDLLSQEPAQMCLRSGVNVRRFYELNDYSPVWTLPQDALMAIAILRDSNQDGLEPANYLTGALRQIDPSSAPNGPGFELALTDAMLAYVGDMYGARSTSVRESLPYDLPPSALDPVATFSNVINRDGAQSLPLGLQSLPLALAPRHAEYAQLRAERRKRATDSQPIAANMERWRWLPAPFERSYIAVNTANATVRFVRDDEVVFSCRVITGKPSTPTPLLRTEVASIIVNPTWDVPSDIAEREIWPKERRHPGFLRAAHMVVDGDAIHQLPGSGNALGRLVLDMPNRFQAYLHDTPNKKLFARADRHLSHGCIRVEKMEALASCILTGDPESGLDEVQDSIASGQSRRLYVPEPLPVYTLYWTAVPSDDGSVEFERDVYGWDSKVQATFRQARACA